MGSSPDINYPAQPSYGEGMADAMKAQMEQLLGQGEYAGMYADAGFAGGNLGDIIAGVESPIRQQTAQVDTDVLRQTLLGTQTKVVKDPETGKYGIPDSEVVESSGDGRYQVIMVAPGRTSEKKDGLSGYVRSYAPKYSIIDTQTGGTLKEIGGEFIKENSFVWGRDYERSEAYSKANAQANDPKNAPLESISIEYQKIINTAAESGDSEVYQKFNFTNPNTGEPLKEGEVVREGDGMIDLLGDKRKALDPTTGKESDRMAGFDAEGNFLGLAALAEDIQRGNLSRQREADLADVERLSGRYSTLMEDYKPAVTSGLDDARSLLEQQRENLTGLREATQADVDAGLATAVGDMIQTGSGGPVTIPTESTYGGNLGVSKIDKAAQVADPLALESSTSYDPSASVSGGKFDAGTSYTAAQVADPMTLTAATSYDPSASVTGDGYTATADLQGGNIGQDAFRQALMEQATAALDNGLSDRELANISNAARARSTMMGRTFDQQGAIDESKALVLEDQNRRMQNRAFAQSALGQEADIRERDLGRGLQASMQNQAALNRAAEFGASQDMQAQLANQAATNQALSQGLSAGLSQEALAAQQQQAKAMADATAANRASEFGVSAGMQQEAQANQAALQAQLANQQATNQAAQFGVGAGMEQDALRAQLGQQASLAQAQLDQQQKIYNADQVNRAVQVNQAQTQQAKQFGVGAQMDAERLNETLRQQGLGNYINAVGNLAQIEDTYTLDPFQALLGRGGGGSLQAGQGVFGQAGYGLNSGPQYLNPEAGLGYISNMAANQANMYAAQLSADATRDAGMMNMFGNIAGAGVGAAIKRCWVAREVYGHTNPAWLLFRNWLDTDSPNWFRNLYIKYGERFANWISNKPRIKSIIRKWMDSKIGGK
jgi:hypothetical protein